MILVYYSALELLPLLVILLMLKVNSQSENDEIPDSLLASVPLLDKDN